MLIMNIIAVLALAMTRIPRTFIAVIPTVNIRAQAKYGTDGRILWAVIRHR